MVMLGALLMLLPPQLLLMALQRQLL